MKNAICKRVLIGIFALIIVSVSALALFACNKQSEKTVTIADVFKSSTSEKEFTSSKIEISLPAGWTVYTSSASTSSESATVNSDVGYIKDMNAFIVAKDGVLTIVKCGDSKVYVNNDKEVGLPGQILPMYYGTTAIRVKAGIIVCKFKNGEAGAYDYNGNTLLSRSRIKGASSVSIDKVIRVLDKGLIAVGPAYDVQGKNGYTSIYRPTTSGSVSERGELVCRVINSSDDITAVSGFDSKYVCISKDGNGGAMFAVPDHAGSEVSDFSAGNGIISQLDKDNYYLEITYIGKGRFLVHEDWTVESTEEYTYYDGNDYYYFRRKIYDAKTDTLSNYTENADKVFLKLTSNYYDASKGGIDTTAYLKDGYLYASYGLNIINKAGFYDQFIFDEDLNVVMSLTGNFGMTLEAGSKDSVGVFDLVMTATDGNYYVPYLPSKVAVYNGNGEKLGENTDYQFVSQNISNGVVVACIAQGNNQYYSLFDFKGNELTETYIEVGGERKHLHYTQLAAFRGYYTIGKRTNSSGDDQYFLIDRDGVEIAALTDGKTPFYDMATTSSGGAIFKIGCYMYKKQTTDSEGNVKYLYGIKNFNVNASNNIVMEATMETGAVLYAPSSSPADVFVFEKFTAVNGDVSYTIHRLV